MPTSSPLNFDGRTVRNLKIKVGNLARTRQDYYCSVSSGTKSWASSPEELDDSREDSCEDSQLDGYYSDSIYQKAKKQSRKAFPLRRVTSSKISAIGKTCSASIQYTSKKFFLTETKRLTNASPRTTSSPEKFFPRSSSTTTSRPPMSPMTLRGYDSDNNFGRRSAVLSSTSTNSSTKRKKIRRKKEKSHYHIDHILPSIASTASSIDSTTSSNSETKTNDLSRSTSAKSKDSDGYRITTTSTSSTSTNDQEIPPNKLQEIVRNIVQEAGDISRSSTAGAFSTDDEKLVNSCCVVVPYTCQSSYKDTWQSAYKEEVSSNFADSKVVLYQLELPATTIEGQSSYQNFNLETVLQPVMSDIKNGTAEMTTPGNEDVKLNEAVDVSNDTLNEELTNESTQETKDVSEVNETYDASNNAEKSGKTTSQTPKRIRRKTTKSSFTADSPYYSAYVDKELRNLTVLTETLKDISARAREFGQHGSAMAEITRNLSTSCKLLQPVPFSLEHYTTEEAREKESKIVAERKESVGPEMGNVLRLLGEVLDEVADAQTQMCESLEASLSLSLEAFAGVELSEATKIRQEADGLTENAESVFSRYLHGRGADRVNPDELGSGTTSSWNKLSDQVGSHLKNWGRSGSGDGVGNDKRGKFSQRSKDVSSVEKEQKEIISSHLAVAGLRQNLEQIRLSQANAELKRFQLLRRLDSLKTRRNFDLGESGLASLHAIRAYFHHCSDLVQGLTPRLHMFQSEQTNSREKHKAQQAPWESRENGLTVAISKVESAASDAALLVESLNRNPTAVTVSGNDHVHSLSEVEDEVKLWDLPRHLADSSLYQRDPTPGVIAEGWLYKKSSSRMTIHAWNKRWFILDKTGVYYLRGGVLHETNRFTNNSAPSASMERVRVCQILLCTVREVNEKAKGSQGLRFCFEIITPNSRPYMLQACGPLEYKQWVDGIRSCIEKQLGQTSISTDKDNLFISSASANLGASAESDGEFIDVHKSDFDGGMQHHVCDGTEEFRRVRQDADNCSFKGNTGRTETADALASPADKKKFSRQIVRKILRANPTCADCSAPSPDWASLNLGVLLCIECSGVHRSLGVHVSKVRSIRLDDLGIPECRLLLSLGNELGNSIWEDGVSSQKGWKKPSSGDGRKAKEEWIKSKYLWRGFIEYKPGDGAHWEDREKKFCKDLYEAARLGHIAAVAEAIAKGGKVEWKNEEEDGKTPLHICALSSSPDSVPSLPVDESFDPDFKIEVVALEKKEKWRGIECAELLIQNGAKMDTLDDNNRGVWDCAVLGNVELEMMDYLQSKLH